MLLAVIMLLNAAHAGGLKSEEKGIKVKIDKPEFATIMNKQHLTPKYDLELTQSFLPKVVESVAEKPF